MCRTGLLVFVIGGVLPVSGLSAQSRQFWVLDPAGPGLRQLDPGAPTVGLLPLGGVPAQVRADLLGRAVVLDRTTVQLTLIGPYGATAVFLPSVAADAVPDGAGGAMVVTGGVNGVCDLLHVDAGGCIDLVRPLPGFGRLVRPISQGRWVVVTIGSDSRARLLYLDVTTNTLLHDELLPAIPRDVVLDNQGRILLPGVHATGIPVFLADDQGLQLVQTVATAFPTWFAMPFGDQDALLVMEGTPPRLRAVGGTYTFAPFSLPGLAGALEGLPDGGVLARGAAQQLAYSVTSYQGVTWFGSWPMCYALNDGAGLQFARAFLDEDPDQDGFSTRVELAQGSDPGRGGSSPLMLRRQGTLLELECPRHPSSLYAILLSESVLPVITTSLPVPGGLHLLCAPGPLMTATLEGGVLDMPLGILSAGRADVHILQPLPPGTWAGCAVFDPATFAVQMVLHARLLQP